MGLLKKFRDWYIENHHPHYLGRKYRIENLRKLSDVSTDTWEELHELIKSGKLDNKTLKVLKKVDKFFYKNILFMAMIVLELESGRIDFKLPEDDEVNKSPE